jgi:hypothetical protein
MSPPPAPLDLSFRQAIVSPVFRAIREGWSCALTAMRGVGASNMARFVAEPRVAAHYLGQEAAHTLIVNLAGAPVGDPAGLEPAIVRDVIASARVAGWPKADLAALRRLADEPIEDELGYVARTRERRLVLVFDEFDGLFLRLSEDTLRRWRRLRDDHKHSLCFLVCTWRELSSLSASRPGGDGRKFAELFDQHTFPLPPYSQAEALDLVARKMRGWPRALSPDQATSLSRAVGGHAKLLVAGLFYCESRLDLPWPEVERGLARSQPLLAICREIWDGLDAPEQLALRQVAAGCHAEAPADILDTLHLLGLTAGHPPVIFASVFESFVMQRYPGAPSHLADRPASRLRDPSVDQAYW